MGKAVTRKAPQASSNRFTESSQAVILVDDHPLIRHALAAAIQTRFPGLNLAVSSTAEEGLILARKILAWPEPTSLHILLDLSLPGLSGLSAIQNFRELSEHISIITLSGNDEDLRVGACLGSGANAFVSKAAPIEVLLDVIQQSLQNTLKLGTWLSAYGFRDSSTIQRLKLTGRQLQVLLMICSGLSNRDIAQELDITEITAKTHVSGVFKALGVASRTQAILMAQQLGLVSG
jgi:DNA-binding NarL/FixJ family response regulator